MAWRGLGWPGVAWDGKLIPSWHDPHEERNARLLKNLPPDKLLVSHSALWPFHLDSSDNFLNLTSFGFQNHKIRGTVADNTEALCEVFIIDQLLSAVHRCMLYHIMGRRVAQVPTINVRVGRTVVERLETLKHPGQSLGGVIEELLQHVLSCTKLPATPKQVRRNEGEDP